jgi:hypothetical protein
MPVLTLEAIRQNPWNVLTHDLPAEPSRLLLNVAQFAAATCRRIESDLFRGRHEGGSGCGNRATRTLAIAHHSQSPGPLSAPSLFSGERL